MPEARPPRLITTFYRLRIGLAVLLALITASHAAASGWTDTPIVERNIDVMRDGAAKRPRNEFEQELYLNWPLYRNSRGQGAFNAAMATLKASQSAKPSAAIFKNCRNLHCPLSLPKIGRGGWFPTGRMWVSPTEYVLFVRWERRRPAFVKRRPRRTMRYFVFHEFHNGTGNTDPYDTISSHNRRVFVPFYLSKTMRDAKGVRFVVMIQVAPYDVRSIHASNRGSAGPGIEVSKNRRDGLQSLQAKAGILVATMVKRRAPQLRVVNHRGSEGRPMLRAYIERIKGLRRRPNAKRLDLPFVRARASAIKTARARLADLIRLPRSFRNMMHDLPSDNKRIAAISPNVRPSRPKLVIAPTIVRRQLLPADDGQSVITSAAASHSPLTAFLRASTGIVRLLSPPKRAVPPWCAKLSAGYLLPRCRQ